MDVLFFNTSMTWLELVGAVLMISSSVMLVMAKKPAQPAEQVRSSPHSSVEADPEAPNQVPSEDTNKVTDGSLWCAEARKFCSVLRGCVSYLFVSFTVPQPRVVQ